ncbi:MAG: class I SAM-dependent methyltransferase [Phycisphaerae bacterium]|nr:class I SAM-dependent methyltransferase [Phycisphaerae bacterium]
MSEFQDLFSKQAALYARFRPSYPGGLIDYLAGIATRRGLAWDVGTGNGQAAVGLAGHFDSVIATDGSSEQIANALPNPRVKYHVALAEGAGPREGLRDHSVDLVTIAQALHWFATEAFFANVRRALHEDGIVAAWCYGISRVESAIDAVVGQLYHEIVGPFWPPDRCWVDDGYRSIPFPFHESRFRDRGNKASSGDDSAVPTFACRESWNLAQYVGYLGSWSAVQRFVDARGYNPLDEIEADLRSAWGEPASPRIVEWPIHMRVGAL